MILQASIYIVFAIFLIVSALLLLVVLMQRPKQEGLGAAFGAQMTDQAFGAQTTDVLKKGTVFFGSLFMILSFVLGVLMNIQYKRTHGSDLGTAPAAAEAPAAAATETPAAAAAEAPAPAAAEAPAPAAAAEAPAPAAEAPAPAAEAPAPAAEAPAPAEAS